MWLDVHFKYAITRHDAGQHIVHWTVDICATSEGDDPEEPQHYVVGRILADEIRRDEIDEWGDDPWEAADADSASLEGVYVSLIRACGESIDRRFNAVNDPVVYIYRFKMHDDFASCKRAAMDAFCRLFQNEALIMAQYHTTWMSLSEFADVGFVKLLDEGESEDEPFDPYDELRDNPRFMVRDNTLATPFGVKDYPKDPPYGKAEHEEWLEQQGPWEGLET
jgi:hypothetical protein